MSVRSFIGGGALTHSGSVRCQVRMLKLTGVYCLPPKKTQGPQLFHTSDFSSNLLYITVKVTCCLSIVMIYCDIHILRSAFTTLSQYKARVFRLFPATFIKMISFRFAHLESLTYSPYSANGSVKCNRQHLSRTSSVILLTALEK